MPSLSTRTKILVIAPPYRLSQTSFPLGLMYIAAVLQNAGHCVEVLDMDVLNLDVCDYARELRERHYDYVCIGGMITAWNFAMSTCDMVSDLKPNAKIIVGGGLISSAPSAFISAAKASVGVIGEGEEAVVEVINAFENGRPLSTVDGIVYKEDGQVVKTKCRKNIENLDSIPFPAWELFKVKETYCTFPSHFSVRKASRMASIYTTRGCPFQCTFCYTEKAVRQRSIGNVIAELKELKERYKVKHIVITDDLFVVRKKRTVEFCEAMIKNKMKLTWSATGRCNIIDKELVKIMKAAGCSLMGLGIESGSETVLKAIKKQQTPKMIVDAVKMVSEAGITPGGSFILGLPPETKESVRETVALYKEINRYRTHVNKFFLATPYPGTSLYEEMRAKGKIRDEIAYFEQLSRAGDATEFLMNCTDQFSDSELIQTKREIEEEVFRDFVKKHPWHGVYQFLTQKTFLGKLRNTALIFKIQGFRKGVQFVWSKLLYQFGLLPNRFERRWHTKKTYAGSQTVIEGRVGTV